MIYRGIVTLVVLLLAPDNFISALIDDRNQLSRRRHFWNIYGREPVLQYLLDFSSATNADEIQRTRPRGTEYESSLVIVDGDSADQLVYFQTLFPGDLLARDGRRDFLLTSVIVGHDRSAPLGGLDLPLSQSNVLAKRGDHKTAGHIEILLVIDNSIFRRYLQASSYDADLAKKKILQYFSIVFAMVNQRLDTISDPDFSLNVQISGVYIAETRMEGAWIEPLVTWSQTARKGLVVASKALRRFQKWLRRSRGLPKYDHAVVFTRYILTKRNQKVDGLAYVGTMCRVSSGKSASIVQDEGDFQSIGIIAHELGHSLGAAHDGKGDNKACPADDNYIMAPQTSQEVSRAKNAYFFSDCSTKQIKRLVLSRQGSCLKDTPTVHLEHDLSKSPPGELYDEDVQCKMAFGRNSEFCDQANVRPLMCQRLWCTSPDTSQMCRTSTRLMALPGTSCGDDKMCHLGECVSTRSSRYRNAFRQKMIPSKTVDCPTGDGSPAYCSVIIRKSPYLCARPHLHQYCCRSCAQTPDYK